MENIVSTFALGCQLAWSELLSDC